jgi:hypothetical protein
VTGRLAVTVAGAGAVATESRGEWKTAETMIKP